MKTMHYSNKLFILGVILMFLNPIVGFAQMSRTAQTNTTEFIKGTIVIKVKEDIGPYEMQKSNISFGIPSLDKKVQEFDINKLEKRFKHKPIQKNSGLPDLSRIYRIEFPESQNVHKVAKEFAEDPNIEYAEPISIGKFTEDPDDPLYGSQQHLPQIMAPEAWDIHKGEDGDEIVIAIVDSGTDWLHPDLTDNCWQNLGEDADGDGVTLEFNNGVWERDPDDMNGIDDDSNGYIDDVIGWDFHEQETLGDGSNPDPLWNQGPFEHGTHCAGIAAGVTNNNIGISSVSHNVIYLPVQVDDGNNTVLYGYDGIIYAAESGADIISNSWGYDSHSEASSEVIEYATSLGSIVVVAAGNANSDVKQYPASYAGAISVAALNPDDTRASFSSFGLAVDVAAPGVAILSTVTNNGYESWNGTSMATPMVAGLFALLKSYQPDWSNDQLIEQVIGTADNIDDINPGYENTLGSGRINAYRTLDEVNVEVTQEIRLDFVGYSIADENGNEILEPGETCSFSFSMQNFSNLVSDESAEFTLTSVNPNVSIISGLVNASIPADGVFEVTDAFEFVIAEDAKAQLADFILEVNSDKEITYGAETEFAAIIAPSGLLVWEGEVNGKDYSGAYIRDFLEARGHDVFYSKTYPESFAGFDAVFLSFGGSDNTGAGTVLQETHSAIIQQYLVGGGIAYCEGSPFFFMSEFANFSNHDEFVNLFGVSSGYGTFVPNPVSKLTGLEGTLNDGMIFNNSSQAKNWYIDKIIPNEGAVVSFSEEGYGNVSVYNEGEYGQKTFYFSYSLAELVDENPHSSRYNILVKLMDFFGYPENDGLVANFSADKTEGKPDLQVQFTDWSITENETEITTWAWDFDEDGEFDSYDQNPTWTYTNGGVYDVSLIVFGDGGEIDTLVKKDFITVRQGILVYEGEENANGYSGTFINEYLENHWYDNIGYTNIFPSSLEGYDAVFLSFGNTGLRGTALTNQMSNALFNYSLSGGNIYLEGGDAIYSMNPSNLWVFGMDNSENGEKNKITDLTGMEEALTIGMEFSITNQLSVRSIDTYSVFETLPGAKAAFTESDYGIVAVEFDGSQGQGQKTFCMSYALADLEDNGGTNTREELLKRIINFFDVVTEVDNLIDSPDDWLSVYPNPTSNELTISGLPVNSVIQITDLSGNLMISEKVYREQVTINLSELPKGIYLIRTNNEVRKIVKM